MQLIRYYNYQSRFEVFISRNIGRVYLSPEAVSRLVARPYPEIVEHIKLARDWRLFPKLSIITSCLTPEGLEDRELLNEHQILNIVNLFNPKRIPRLLVNKQVLANQMEIEEELRYCQIDKEEVFAFLKEIGALYR